MFSEALLNQIKKPPTLEEMNTQIENTIEYKEFKEENIYLVEWQPPSDIIDNKNSETVNLPLANHEGGFDKVVKGLKVYCIHDSKGNQIAMYDQPKDVTNLSNLRGKEGGYLCSVEFTSFNIPVWMINVLGGVMISPASDNSSEKAFYMFSLLDRRQATDKESELLDSIFKGFKEKCYLQASLNK